MTQADIPAPTPEDDVIEKQERVEYVVDQELSGQHTADQAEFVDETELSDAVDAQHTADQAEFASQGSATIASPTAPGVTYDQAEAASMKTAVDAIRAALTAAGITA